jgi:hypothetical protein
LRVALVATEALSSSRASKLFWRETEAEMTEVAEGEPPKGVSLALPKGAFGVFGAPLNRLWSCAQEPPPGVEGPGDPRVGNRS